MASSQEPLGSSSEDNHCVDTSLTADISDILLTECTVGTVALEQFTPQWEKALGCEVQDIIWDVDDSGWWLRLEKELCWVDVKGTEVIRIGKGIIEGCGQLLLHDQTFITTDGGEKVKFMSKSGKLIREVIVPWAKCLRGVTYCHHRDVYIFTDTHHHCLWYVNNGNGRVTQQMGSLGSENNHFNKPISINHHTLSKDKCHIAVSDCNNHCMKIFSPRGEFIRQLGTLESGDQQLNYPGGICADKQGRMVVCDTGYKRVVRYSSDEYQTREVLLTAKQLNWRVPKCVCICPTEAVMVVVIDGGRGLIINYQYTGLE